MAAASITGKKIKRITNETIDSDDSTSYIKLKDIVKEHRPQVIPKKEIAKMLPWVHIVISNAKRMLLDIFHDIKPEYLQNYLNFVTSLIAGISAKTPDFITLFSVFLQ